MHRSKFANFPNGHSRARAGRREDLGIYVRSTWEANYARYLKWLVMLGEIRRWEYEPETFEFHGIKRGSRFYTPDFKITNNDGSIEYHEIKGYMDQPSLTKLKRMAKYYPNIIVKVLRHKDMAAIRKTASPMIDYWEIVRDHYV
jgi:hypothetical protein